MNSGYHQPVLLKESIDALNIKEGGVYVDATYGGGGHSAAILERLGSGGVLIAFDQDADAWEQAGEDPRLKRVHANFRFLRQYVRYHGHREVDGLLADLGVSSHQFDTGERGFSTRYEGPLDMRMDRTGTLTAAQVVNQYELRALQRVLADYGELRAARAMSEAIGRARELKPLESTEELLGVLSKFLPRGREHKISAQLFQALRIEVNGEMEALGELLVQAAGLLREGGRMAVISYHSLEDRMVKRFIRDGRFDGKEAEKDMYGRFEVPFRKVGAPVKPGPQEITDNPRSRSAILRVAERTNQPKS